MFSLRDLECFVAVVEHGTFRRAAAALNIAQPPLSRRIADLESQIGGDVFVRGAGAIELTELGRILWREARSLLQHAAIAERSVKESLSRRHPALRVGFTSSSSGFTLIPAAVRAYRARRPEATIKLGHYIITLQSEALRMGLIDLAIVAGVVDTADFAAAHLATKTLILALPADHALAQREHIRVTDLADEPFIEFPRHAATGIYDNVRGVFAREGLIPNVVQEADGHDIVLACVAAGIGIALVNEMARTLPFAGIVYRELEPESPAVPLTAIWRPSDDNPAIAEFVDTLRDVARANGAGRQIDHKVNNL